MYRLCVLVVLYDFEKKLFFTAKRSNTKNGWQFVQGGVDSGELLVNAAMRELREETNIIVSEFDEFSGPYFYDYPKHVNYKEKGQEQTWFLKNIKVEDIQNIILNDEFSEYKWETLEFVLENIIDFKKDVYKKALSDLKFI